MTTLKQLPTIDIGSGSSASFDVSTTSEPLSTQVDDVGGGVVYIGQASAGSSFSSSVWRIKKVTFVGDDVSVQWASSGAFSLVWNDRLSYSYS